MLILEERGSCAPDAPQAGQTELDGEMCSPHFSQRAVPAFPMISDYQIESGGIACPTAQKGEAGSPLPFVSGLTT